MKKYLSRKMSRLSALTGSFFCIMMVLAFLFHSLIVWAVGAALGVAYIALSLHTNRCPYCGEGFKGFYWSKPNAGYCRKCGKFMVFDDCNESNYNLE